MKMKTISISSDGYLACGVFIRDKACPASFSHLCNLPFLSFQPQSRSLHALPAPPHRFLPSHLIYGVADDGYGITGGWLSSVGHGWAQRGAGSVPEVEMVGRATAGSGFLMPRWSMPMLHLCVHVCGVSSCVCVHALMQGGRDTLTGAGPASSFLSNSSTAAHLLWGVSAVSPRR